MDISMLREFVVLADNLNFSATAKQLYISQPVLSRHIQILEKELGIPLLIRDSHSVRPTKSGRLLARRLKRILLELDRALEEANQLDADIESRLNIGYLIIASDSFLPELCHRFHIVHSGVHLSLHALEIDEIVEGVSQGSLDIGYTTIMDGAIPNGLCSLPLIQERYGVIVHTSHRLASFDTISIADLQPYPVLIPSREAMSSASYAARQFLKQDKVDLDIREEMNDIGSVKPFLLNTGGAAFSVSHAIAYFGAEYTFVPVEADGGTAPVIAALWKKSHESELLLSFISLLEQTVLAGNNGPRS